MQTKVPNGKNIIGSGAELCGADQKVKDLANVLLGNLLVVDDLNEAIKNPDLDGWNMVDLNGAYSGKNFVLKYHGKNSDGSLIGRQKKIESIQRSIEKIGIIINRQGWKLKRDRYSYD